MRDGLFKDFCEFMPSKIRKLKMNNNQNTINPEFIIKIKDKEFVIFKGILDIAHQEGLCFIDTEIRQFPNVENNNTAIIKATVKTEKGTFSGTGDANPENVNYMIKPHIIRMAETRAAKRSQAGSTSIACGQAILA